MRAGSVSGPVREGIASRVTECGDEVADAGTALAKILDQAGPISGIMAGPPFLRHPFGERPKVCAVDLFSPAEDGFKTLPSRYILID
ncbi:MAG: hypothetical protein DMG96_08805 [Acidobacteria bacterium]|nr:MAG: hypothetical protein DMG96_08805 [Acidobacteriota bacterium]